MRKTSNSEEELNITISSETTVGFQSIEPGANQASVQVILPVGLPQQANSLEALKHYLGSSLTFLNAEHSSNEELGVNVTGENSGNTGNISE
ncbi:hypothetical protein [Rickettsia endosymbiont of Culicoides newsteadi]|uniref:hypothetical protein n=1 Tax=Rickettsia endosymbiont of Culicoides newsteadi TaxID=1961830 RepID=UPI000B9B2732|nr:hypothetical protein [Rickettsia endosymbiont of Culicoides newsteadi]OZG31904.1 hypothetical protein RiCNE_06850 [Rickettsia endosymbiont of Culicoides newsteadi]